MAPTHPLGDTLQLPGSSGATTASYDSEDGFPNDFLHAQADHHELHQERPHRSGEWDQYVVSSAAAYEVASGGSSDSTSTAIVSQITDICTYLVDVFRALDKYQRFLDYRGDAAQDLLDLLQKLLDYRQLEKRFKVILYVALFRLCRKSELYPRCFTLTDVKREEYPVTDGGFGEIYRGTLGGRDVCIKVVKMYANSNQPFLHKAFSREAVLWGQLWHINVLPFFGIHRFGDTRNRMCLVSPWMHNGNINDFLRKKPDANRRLLVSDVSAGMLYLHENGVIHGDLKGANTLVTEDERACLADFGLSYVKDSKGLKDPTLSSNNAEGGTIGFQAPELVDPEHETTKRTEASDVYAFGMICYEILVGKPPFANYRNNYMVIIKVSKGEFPERPMDQTYLDRGLTDIMWTLMEQCWSRLPANRPSAARVDEQLPRLTVDPRPKGGWADVRSSGFDVSGSNDGSGDMDVAIERALPHLKSLLA